MNPECSSFCHPDEPCCITDDGICDALPKPKPIMIRLKIDLQKFTGAKTFTAKDGQEFLAIPIEGNFHKGAKGLYCDLTLMTNRDGRDKYDNDGFAIHDLGKQRREAGEKGPILGNWKDLDGGDQSQGRDVSAQEATRKMHGSEAKTTAGPTQPDDETDIPF